MNTFTFSKTAPTTFDIKSDFDGKVSTRSFRLGELTNWQVGEMNKYVAQLLKESEGIGSVIITAILSFANDGDSAELQKVMKGFSSLSKGSGFVSGLTSGISSIFGFFGKDSNMSRLAAILYLAEGEYKLDEAQFNARIDLFDCIPAGQTWGAVMAFFTSKMSSLTNSPLFSQISGMTMKSDASPNSETSIETSTGSSDSSITSLKDRSNDDPAPLESPSE
jgi:hypothetical protein